MPRSCTVCHSPHLEGIELWLKEGQPLSAISRKFGVSRDALRRHAKHTQEQKALGTLVVMEEAPASDGGDLLKKLHKAEVLIDSVIREAERHSDNRTRLLAAREQMRAVELEAKLCGALESRAGVVNNTIAIVDDATAVKIARTFVERYGAKELEGDALEAKQ
jgi:hypothetical protein